MSNHANKSARGPTSTGPAPQSTAAHQAAVQAVDLRSEGARLDEVRESIDSSPRIEAAGLTQRRVDESAPMVAQRRWVAAASSFAERRGRHASGPFEPVQRTVKSSPKDGKAGTVTADYKDHKEALADRAKGTPPKEDPPGFDHIRKQGLTGMWVRFHILNENAGGPGLKWNLTPTSQATNQASDWKAFETTLKADTAKAKATDMKFVGQVAYHAATKAAEGVEDQSKFPSEIHATFDRTIAGKKQPQAKVDLTGLKPPALKVGDRVEYVGEMKAGAWKALIPNARIAQGLASAVSAGSWSEKKGDAGKTMKALQSGVLDYLGKAAMGDEERNQVLEDLSEAMRIVSDALSRTSGYQLSGSVTAYKEPEKPKTRKHAEVDYGGGDDSDDDMGFYDEEESDDEEDESVQKPAKKAKK